MASYNATLVGTTTLRPLNTVVGTRVLRPEQAWFEGHGRGYIREFVPVEGRQFCTACNEHHDLKAFPTFSVPRADGRTRSNVCRAKVRAQRVANAKRAKVLASCAKARAAKAAKKAQVNA
jgi:hypothetical protein